MRTDGKRRGDAGAKRGPLREAVRNNASWKKKNWGAPFGVVEYEKLEAPGEVRRVVDMTSGEAYQGFVGAGEGGVVMSGGERRRDRRKVRYLGGGAVALRNEHA